MPAATKSSSTIMDELLTEVDSSLFTLPKLGTLVEGIVIDIVGNKILIDINGVATGIIAGKESNDSHGTLKQLKPGDKVSAYLIGGEDEDGYFSLSLRKASQEKTWRTFLKAYEESSIIQVVINEANKGGLLVMVDGIKGFIPVSQLAPLHYPRVDGANPSEILLRLQKLINEKLNVKIISIDQEEGKLILSEKAAMDDEREASLKSLKVGDIVSGHISGIVKFGIFVAFNGLEGLVHISEIEWGHVKDPSTYGKIGNPVTVKIIGIENDKISLSMKQLMPDPWQEAAKKLTIGKKVVGTVDRITQFGIFLKLENDISGLIHLSELADEPVKDPHKFVKVGQELEAKIISIDIDERRIGLSLKSLHDTESQKKEEETELQEIKEKTEKTTSKKTAK